MTSLPLVRTEYLNTSTNTVRTGATSHGESLTDMESYLLRHSQVSSSVLHSWGSAATPARGRRRSSAPASACSCPATRAPRSSGTPASAGRSRPPPSSFGGRSDVYVAEEVRDNAFSIAGGEAGQRVSWLLVGVRHDPWALTHEMVVEEDKPEDEQGLYHAPEAYGRDATASVHWARHADGVKKHPVLVQRLAQGHTEYQTERLRAAGVAVE